MTMVSFHACKSLRVAELCVAASQVPDWQLLLDAAVAHKADALLDCGALLANVDSR
jgi:hypothetical protein